MLPMLAYHVGNVDGMHALPPCCRPPGVDDADDAPPGAETIDIPAVAAAVTADPNAGPAAALPGQHPTYVLEEFCTAVNNEREVGLTPCAVASKFAANVQFKNLLACNYHVILLNLNLSIVLPIRGVYAIRLRTGRIRMRV